MSASIGLLVAKLVEGTLNQEVQTAAVMLECTKGIAQQVTQPQWVLKAC